MAVEVEGERRLLAADEGERGGVRALLLVCVCVDIITTGVH